MTTNNSIHPGTIPGANHPLHSRVSKRSLTKLIFYIVFIFVYSLSGLLTMLSIMTGFPYRMGFVSGLVLPLILLYGIKANKVLIAYGFLATIILLSGLYNHITAQNTILFMRTLVFSYLIFRLVDIYLRPENVNSVIHWCVILSVIQLPVILLQRLTSPYWPTIIKENISQLDVSFGTFNFKSDAPMTFFLTAIVIFLLFNQKTTVFKHKWIILGWLTLTVLVSNAELMKIVIMLVWAFYFFTHAKAKIILYVSVLFLCLLGFLAVSGVLNQSLSRFWYSFQANTQLTYQREQRFLSGDYARGTAIAYYLNQKIKLLGDGPSVYYNVFTRSRVLGNTGHIFTFYAEVGLLGWLASTAIFFLIAFPIRHARIMIGWAPLLMFLSIQLLSFTSEIMNDISIVLTYGIFTKAFWFTLPSTLTNTQDNSLEKPQNG